MFYLYGVPLLDMLAHRLTGDSSSTSEELVYLLPVCACRTHGEQQVAPMLHLEALFPPEALHSQPSVKPRGADLLMQLL